MNRVKRCLELCLERDTRRTATRLAVVVGSLLVAINHGDTILAHQNPDWIKVLLTYLVPYGVSTYSSVKKELSAETRHGKREQGE